MNLLPMRRVLAAGAVIALGMAACTSGASPSPADGGATTTVAVKLQEWAVVPTPASAPAGGVTFSVTNDGPDDVHEFVVLKTDLDPGALPTDETGAVT